MKRAMRLELTRIGLLIEFANHDTTRGAFMGDSVRNDFLKNEIRRRKGNS